MELRHLRYFIAIAEELHFGRAAKRLGISQQPLSQQIRNLEAELGTPLFYRTKRTVRLTEAGQVFYDGAVKTLQQVEQTVHFAQRTGRGEIGNLSVGLTGPALSSLLPQVMSRFRQEYQGVNLTLNEMRTNLQVEALLQGQLHVGLLHTPLYTDSLATQVIYRENLVLVLPTSHRLAHPVEMTVSLRDLAGEPFIFFPRKIGPIFYDRIISMFQQVGYSPNIVQEVIPQRSILSLASIGVGLTLMQKSLSTIGHSGVVFRELLEPTPELELALAWHPKSTHPALQNFLRLVREVASGHQPS